MFFPTRLFSFSPPRPTARLRRLAKALGTIATMVAGAPLAEATDRTWLNSASPSALWETAANWSGNSVPGVVASNNDNAFISANLGANQTITLGADRSLNSLTVGDTQSPLFAYTIATGAFALDIAASGQLVATLTHSAGAGPVTISGNLTFRSSDPFELNAAADPANPLTISAAISSPAGGSGAITKIGSGTAVFSGVNTYVGYTNVTEGTLRLGADQAIPSATSQNNFFLSSGATLDLNGRQLSLRSVGGSGGTIMLGGGSLQIGPTFGVGVMFEASITGVGAVIIANNVHLSSKVPSPFVGTLTIGTNGTYGVDSTSALPGVTAIAVGGSFGGLFLSGTNQLDPLAAVSSTSSGGSFEMTGGDQSIGSMTGDLKIKIYSAATLTIGANNAPTTYSGQMEGSGGALKKVGTGTLTLAHANFYEGGTRISGGKLAIGALGTIGTTGNILIDVGATLDLTALGTDGFVLDAGRTLTNHGTILGTFSVSGDYLGNGVVVGNLIINGDGTIARTSGSLNVTGTIQNFGTIRLTHGAVLNATGSIDNQGLLDLLTAGGTPPTGVTGNGVVLTVANVGTPVAAKLIGSTEIRLAGFTGHTYRVRRSLDLANGSFQDQTGVTPLPPTWWAAPAARCCSSIQPRVRCKPSTRWLSIRDRDIPASMAPSF